MFCRFADAFVRLFVPFLFFLNILLGTVLGIRLLKESPFLRII